MCMFVFVDFICVLYAIETLLVNIRVGRLRVAKLGRRRAQCRSIVLFSMAGGERECEKGDYESPISDIFFKRNL